MLYLDEKLLSFYPLFCTESKYCNLLFNIYILKIILFIGDNKILVMSLNKLACYQLWNDTQVLTKLMDYPQPIGYQNYKTFSILNRYTSKINQMGYVAISLSNNTIQVCDLSNGYNLLHLNNPVQ